MTVWIFGFLHHRGKRKQFLCLDSSDFFLHLCAEGGSAPPQPCQLQGHHGQQLLLCPGMAVWPGLGSALTARRDLAPQRTSTGLKTAERRRGNSCKLLWLQVCEISPRAWYKLRQSRCTAPCPSVGRFLDQVWGFCETKRKLACLFPPF